MKLGLSYWGRQRLDNKVLRKIITLRGAVRKD
jgi:hypothetical protein